MAKKVIVEKQEDRYKYCEALENGDILFFSSIPFDFPKEDLEFLLKQRQGGSSARKNIAYKPQLDRITNHDTSDPKSAERLKEILRKYSQSVASFLSGLLSPYADHWRLDYASFRPFQEKGRSLRLRARNDLLHVDAFPTRPLHGSRIFRFFTNINPVDDRVWITSDGFEALASQFANKVSIPPSVGFSLKERLERKMKAFLRLKLRSPYDIFMLRFHNYLKETQEFQRNCHKDHWQFPPFSCWAVFTDQVSHAALAGQYALEQTILIPQKALLCPEKSPVSVLQRMSGKNLIDQKLLAESFPS